MDEWGNSDDTYESFGADSYNDSDEFADGYQINEYIDGRETTGDYTGRNAGSTFEYRDAAQESYEANLERESISEDTLMGKATTGDLLFGRSLHSDASTRQAQKDFLLGNTTLGLGAEDAQAARDEFSSTIGGSSKAWANRVNVNPDHLPSDITAISPVGYSVAGIELDPRFGIEPGKRKYRRGSELSYPAASGGDALLTTSSVYGSGTKSAALGMLGESAGQYLDRGPGGKMVGNYGGDVEGRINADNDLLLSKNLMSGLVDLYIHKDTIGSPRERGLRQQVENALTTRLIDGVFADGARSVLPTPNELNIAGLKPTMSYRGNVGTAYDRVGFDVLTQEKGWTADNPEYWQHKPNVKGSLFGEYTGKMTDAQKADLKVRQESKMQNWVTNAHVIREILRKESPTHSNESAGQMRMAGFYRPYGEQADRANLMNEAEILGLEHGQASDEDMTQEMTAADIQKFGKGSSRATMYGEKTLSEIDVFVEKGEEADPVTVVDPDFEGIPQRTPEWYAARKDLVTASMLLDFGKGKTRTPESLAAEIYKGKLKTGDEFLGNAYTKEGELGEGLVRANFLKHMNKDENGNPYSHKDVGLIIGEGRYDGMGASPDGRVYKDGKPDGLAEFKYLTSDSMKSTKKYDDQMQMQMMITGEDKVHFYALNKYTGASEYRIVNADPNKQAALRNDINKARELSGSLTATQVKEIEMAQEGKFSAEENAGLAGQAESIPDVEGEAPMTVVGSTSPVTAASMNERENILGRKEKKDFIKSVERGFGSVDDMRKFDAAADAADKRAKADRDAARATKEFSTSLKNFLGGLTGAAINAGESGMDTVRAAAMAGFSAEDVRGTEFALVQEGNLTEGQARNVTTQAAKVQAAFNDPRAVGGAYSEMFANWESRGLGKSLGALPSMGEIAKSGIGYVDMVQGFLNNAPDTVEGRKDRAWGASILGIPELAISDIQGDVVKSADGFDSTGLREFNEGVKSVQQSVQTLAESLAAASGQAGGTAAAGTQAVLSATPTISAAANVLTAAGVTGAVGSIMKGGSALQGAATSLTKAGGVLAAAGAGYAAGTALYDNAIAGTGVGDAIGSTIAHTMAFFGSDEAQRALDLMDTIEGDPEVRGRSTGGRSGRVNNTNVTVNVDPDMVRTTVDQDGEQFMDQEMLHGS